MIVYRMPLRLSGVAMGLLLLALALVSGDPARRGTATTRIRGVVTKTDETNAEPMRWLKLKSGATRRIKRRNRRKVPSASHSQTTAQPLKKLRNRKRIEEANRRRTRRLPLARAWPPAGRQAKLLAAQRGVCPAARARPPE